MTSLLRVHLVQYRCSCGVWYPLCHLHFCRKCSELRCLMCLNEEIDIVYCPCCMESANAATVTSSSTAATFASASGSVGGVVETAQQRKVLRCNQCHQCPHCGNLLVSRANNDRYFLQCNACQWTSVDAAGLPTELHNQQPGEQQPQQLPPPAVAVANAWATEHANPVEGTFNEVLTLLRGLSTYEKAERGRLALTSRRSTALGQLTNDRYSLQNAYNARKKALAARPKSTEVHVEASGEVPQLPAGIFDTPVEVSQVPTLQQVLAQPLYDASEGRDLVPARVKLIARRSLRCVQSDTILYKGEYSPSVVKPRLQSFAMDFLPDIRLSREVQVPAAGQPFSFLLTIANNSVHPMRVAIKGAEADEGGPEGKCIDCSEFALEEFTIPCKDDTADIDEYLHQQRGSTSTAADEQQRLTYIRRHNVGVSVQCQPPSHNGAITPGSYALLHLSYSFPQPSAGATASIAVGGGGGGGGGAEPGASTATTVAGRARSLAATSSAGAREESGRAAPTEWMMETDVRIYLLDSKSPQPPPKK